MSTGQRKVHAARVRNGTPIIALERMPRAKGIVHMTRGLIKIRSTVERNNAPQTTIGIPAVTRTITNIVNPIADVLVVARQAIGKINVESLGRAVAPWLVAGHACPADIHHGAVACCRIGLAPASPAEAAFGVNVGLVVDAV